MRPELSPYQLTNISDIRSLEQPDSTHRLSPEKRMETRPSFTGRLDQHVIKFSQKPTPFLQWLRIIIKNISPSLYITAFQFHLPPLPSPVSFFVAVPSVSLLFIFCFFLYAPPSPPPSLSPQSISLQWSGRLTAAPPEEYQSMLLWRQNQTPLFYFPLSFFFQWSCMWLFMN